MYPPGKERVEAEVNLGEKRQSFVAHVEGSAPMALGGQPKSRVWSTCAPFFPHSLDVNKGGRMAPIKTFQAAQNRSAALFAAVPSWLGLPVITIDGSPTEVPS